MTKSATKTTRTDLAIAALTSDDHGQVSAALDRIDESGDARAILPLLNALVRYTRMAQESPEVKGAIARITSMLYAVKADGAAKELLEALDRPELVDVRNTVIASFWNAGLDVRDHLARFVALAIEGEPATTFECLTVIENQEFWPVDDAAAALIGVKKAAATETNDHKGAMLHDLVRALEERALPA